MAKTRIEVWVSLDIEQRINIWGIFGEDQQI